MGRCYIASRQVLNSGEAHFIFMEISHSMQPQLVQTISRESQIAKQQNIIGVQVMQLQAGGTKWPQRGGKEFFVQGFAVLVGFFILVEFLFWLNFCFGWMFHLCWFRSFCFGWIWRTKGKQSKHWDKTPHRLMSPTISDKFYCDKG